MKINTPHFGPLDVDDSKVIEFPKGLPGFEHCKRFSLHHEDSAQPIVFTLQSLDEPEFALSIADPARFGLHYELTLSESDTSELQLGATEDVAVAVVLNRAAASSIKGKIGANLMAPLIINTRERRGLQQLIARGGFDITLKPVAAAS